MVAGIFAAHGLRYGRGGETLGYKSFENREMKAFLRNMARRSGKTFPEWLPDMGGAEKLAKSLQIDLFKCSVEQWLPLKSFSTAVKIKRNPEAAARSVSDKNGGSYDKALWYVKTRYEMMDTIPGPTVNSDAVIRGDFTTLENAFEYCGMEFNPARARKVIKPGLWHYPCSA